MELPYLEVLCLEIPENAFSTSPLPGIPGICLAWNCLVLPYLSGLVLPGIALPRIALPCLEFPSLQLP